MRIIGKNSGSRREVKRSVRFSPSGKIGWTKAIIAEMKLEKSDKVFLVEMDEGDMYLVRAPHDTPQHVDAMDMGARLDAVYNKKFSIDILRMYLSPKGITFPVGKVTEIKHDDIFYRALPIITVKAEKEAQEYRRRAALPPSVQYSYSRNNNPHMEEEPA